MPRTLASGRTLATNRFPIAGLTFDGSQNYLSCGNLGSLGSSLGSGAYFSFNMRTIQTSVGCIFGAGNAGSTTALIIFTNATSGGGAANQKMRFFLRDNSGKILDAAPTSTFNFNDGLIHRFVVTMTGSTNTVVLTMDGNNIPITNGTASTPVTFSNFSAGSALGARNNNGAVATWASATIDSFKIGTSSSVLFASYLLGEGAGTSAGDATGNGNTGTLTGSPLPTWITRTLASGRTLAT